MNELTSELVNLVFLLWFILAAEFFLLKCKPNNVFCLEPLNNFPSLRPYSLSPLHTRACLMWPLSASPTYFPLSTQYPVFQPCGCLFPHWPCFHVCIPTTGKLSCLPRILLLLENFYQLSQSFFSTVKLPLPH